MSVGRWRTVLLFGAPGVGKGTQGRILKHVPGFFHAASGDVFRGLDRDSADGRRAFHHIDRGELAPDDLTVRVVLRAIEQSVADGRFQPDDDVLVLDGIPRTLPQAQMLDEHLEILKIINLSADNDEALIARIRGRALKEQRDDDADEQVIRNRFEVYRRQTAPVLAHYPTELAARINGLASPARVLCDILQALLPVLPGE